MSEPKNINLLDRNDIHAKDISGKTLLFYAVKYGVHSVAEDLLRAGCSPNIADSKGDYPIHEAVERPDTEMIRLLVQYGKV